MHVTGINGEAFPKEFKFNYFAYNFKKIKAGN